MKRNVLIGLTFVLALITLSVQSKPTDEIFEKEYQESYQVNENATLNVENIYGDLFLTSWDKSEIKIVVIVTVESDSKRSRVSDFFQNIQIKMSGDADFVKAITHMPSFKHSGRMDISIDYHISLPETIKLDIDLKYGNIILNTDWVGPTKLEVKYGSLQARSLASRENNIEVQYGELIIENINVSNIDIAYSEVSIESVTTLELRTSYGEVELGVVGSLDLKTAFDEIEISEITDLYARSNFSEIEIDILKNSLEIDSDYGELSINYVAKDFKFIKIDSNNAGIEIEMDESASYDFEVVTRYGDFYIENERSFSKDKLSFNSFRYTGTVGSSNGGEVIIDSSYASVEIK